MSDAIIALDNVTKSYGGVVANRAVSLTVERGGITGLIGPNGSGKTTLFNSIVDYHPIDSGSIRFEGEEISQLRVQEIARLGMLRTFQATRIYGKMTCMQNMLISIPHRKAGFLDMFAYERSELAERAEHLPWSRQDCVCVPAGDAEVGQRGGATVVDEDVGGLHVAVNQACRMKCVERPCDLADHRHQRVGFERPLVGNPLAERPAGEVGHHKVVTLAVLTSV